MKNSTDVISIHDYLTNCAKEFGDKTAIIRYSEDCDQPSYISFNQLIDKTNQTINLYQDIGVVEGDVIAVMLPDMPDKGIINNAAATVAIQFPIEAYLGESVVVGMLEKVKPKVLVVCERSIDPLIWNTFVAIKEKLTFIPHIICVNNDSDDDNDESLIPYNKRVNNYSTSEFINPLPVSPDRDVTYFLTGGTTSLPKIIILDAKSLYYAVFFSNPQMDDVLELTSASVYFTIMDVCHRMFQLHTGCTLLSVPNKYLLGSSKQNTLADILERHGASHVFLPTDMVPMLTQNQGFQSACNKSIKSILVTGNLITPSVFNKLRSITSAKIVDTYGAVETGGISYHEICDIHDVGRLGNPFSTVGVKVVDRLDANKFAEVKDNAIGELAVHGPSMTQRRLYGDTNSRKLEGGWYLTGDLAKRDENGEYWLVGRSEKSVRLTGTKFLEADEAESLLSEHESVQSLAVIPIIDHKGATLLSIFVCPVSGCFLEERDFQQYCLQALELEQSPVQLRVFVMSELLYVVRGKLDRQGMQRIAMQRILGQTLEAIIPGSKLNVTVSSDPDTVHRVKIHIAESAEASDSIADRVNNALKDMSFPYDIVA